LSTDGQLLQIASNTTVFSLIGTIYGGNGTNTFALPDLRGRVALHQGQGPGLTARALGAMVGTESEPIAVAQLAPHTHTVAIPVPALSRWGLAALLAATLIAGLRFSLHPGNRRFARAKLAGCGSTTSPVPVSRWTPPIVFGPR
jgi:microcystin-dependent protein